MYSGAEKAGRARVSLGRALEALQQDPAIPQEVVAVAQNVAQAVGALFEAEKASSEPDGKTCVRAALGSLSQTLALLQDTRDRHAGIAEASHTVAEAMSLLYPLTVVPTAPPREGTRSAAPPVSVPVAPRTPKEASVPVEANIGATTESNFYVGFSGEIGDGGVFVATYEALPKGTYVDLLVTLPGGFECRAKGTVRFVRDPLDFTSDAQPGMGIHFEDLKPDVRELILRFIRKRPPIFYDE